MNSEPQASTNTTATTPVPLPATTVEKSTPTASPVAVKKKAVRPKAKSAVKTTTAPSALPAAAPKAVKVDKSATPKSAAKPEKLKKPKLIRDSFTFPQSEYDMIDALKARATRLKHPAKKSEVLRAGLKLLAALSDAAFRSALQAVPALKTGRPKS